jgi:hypothetical protein
MTWDLLQHGDNFTCTLPYPSEIRTWNLQIHVRPVTDTPTISVSVKLYFSLKYRELPNVIPYWLLMSM